MDRRNLTDAFLDTAVATRPPKRPAFLPRRRVTSFPYACSAVLQRRVLAAAKETRRIATGPGRLGAAGQQDAALAAPPLSYFW